MLSTLLIVATLGRREAEAPLADTTRISAGNQPLPSARPTGLDAGRTCVLPVASTTPSDAETDPLAGCQPCHVTWTVRRDGTSLNTTDPGCVDEALVSQAASAWTFAVRELPADLSETQVKGTFLYGKDPQGSMAWAFKSGHVGPKDAASADAPTHYSEVVPKKRVNPPFPEAARAAGATEARCTVYTQIDERGLPTHMFAFGCPLAFAEGTLDATEQWRFVPMKKDGQAIPAAFSLTFKFQLTSSRSSGHSSNHGLPTASSPPERP